MWQFIAFLLLSFSISSNFAATASPGSPSSAVSAPAAVRQQCNDGDEAATSRVAPVIRKTAPGEILKPYELRLGEYVTLQVPHEKYVAFFTKQGDNVLPTPVLYLDNLAINGLTWTTSGCEKIAFFLERTEASRDIWGKTLSRLDGKQNIPVGIGTLEKGFVTDIGSAKLMLTYGHKMIFWYIGMLLLIALTSWLGIATGLLRDLPAPADGSQQPCTGKGRPFSLARVQMAWWFILTLGAYAYIWLKTGELYNTMPDSILTLMGISAGTTVLSAVVDTNVPERHAEESCGFFNDILSDSDSISFHRFQMLVWTIVLGFIFVNKVSATLIMPDFDTQLLGLMGISSATYLGFKIPAASAAAASTRAAAKVKPPKGNEP